MNVVDFATRNMNMLPNDVNTIYAHLNTPRPLIPTLTHTHILHCNNGTYYSKRAGKSFKIEYLAAPIEIDLDTPI